MSEHRMDDNTFWINLWRTVATTFILFCAIIGVYNYTSDVKYYEAWNNCVDSGGQPVRQTMMGSESITFTCIVN